MKNSLKKLGGALVWEGKKRFYRWRVPFGICFLALLIVCLLPGSVCRFLDTHTRWIVAAVNLFFSFSVLFGLLILPYSSLSAPYDSTEYQRERAGDIGTGLRMLARISMNLVQSTMVLALGYMTMWGMDKFSDASHRYFSLSLSDDPPRVLAVYGLFVPVVYLAFYLRQYRKHRQKQYVFSYIGAMLVAELVTKFIEDLQKNLRLEPGIGADCLWFFMVFLVTGLCFWRCCRLEDEI